MLPNAGVIPQNLILAKCDNNYYDVTVILQIFYTDTFFNYKL